jgi:hypothetical protein
MTKSSHRDWAPILREAARIVSGYSYPITLRQLHYRLLMTPRLGYGTAAKDYDYLSSRTAKARRQGQFPALSDETRAIELTPFWASPQDALAQLADEYRRDRTDGQRYLIALGGEKRTMLAQFREWYPDLGLPFIPLSGNASQTLVDQAREFVAQDGREAVLLYVGDLDPSGEEIERDFLKRCPVWKHFTRVAVTEQQIGDLGLPRNPGKPNDPKARPFVERHGSVFQVEVEAIPPDRLRELYDRSLGQWWDQSAFGRVVADEEGDRRWLRGLLP